MLPIFLITLTTFAINSQSVQIHNHIGFVQFNEPVPTFISALSIKAQYDYKMLRENTTISVRNKNQLLNKWAQDYNVTAKYNEYVNQMTVTNTQFNQNITQLINRLSSVNAQILQIVNNDSMSTSEQKAAVIDLKDDDGNEQAVSTILFIRRLFNNDDTLTKTQVVNKDL